MSTTIEQRFFRVLRISIFVWGCFIVWGSMFMYSSELIHATLHCNNTTHEVTTAGNRSKVLDEYVKICLSETEVLALYEKSLPEYVTFNANYTAEKKTDLVNQIKDNVLATFGYDTTETILDNYLKSGEVVIDYQEEILEWGHLGYTFLMFFLIFILSPLALEKIVWRYIRYGKIGDKKNKFYIF